MEKCMDCRHLADREKPIHSTTENVHVEAKASNLRKKSSNSKEKNANDEEPATLSQPDSPTPQSTSKSVCAELPSLPARYTIAVLACIGLSLTAGMRCNMSSSLVASMNTGHKHWTVEAVYYRDLSYFLGYFTSLVPGGILATKYPATKIFGAAIFISALLNAHIPWAMSAGTKSVVIVKLAQGLVEGVTFPACHGIWMKWAPPMERTTLAALAFSGTYIGVVIGMPLSSLLGDLFGWREIFYIYGVFGLIWYIMWKWLVFERPGKHPRISDKESTYIEKSLETMESSSETNIFDIPWMKIATSGPVLAINVANFCKAWIFWLLVIFQATFFNTQKTTEVGFVDAFPHLVLTLLVPLGSLLADYMRKHGIMSTTNVRKVFTCVGFGLEAIFLLHVACAYEKYTATTELSLSVAYSGLAVSGYNVNHLDIAPRYASILMGLSNAIGTLACFIVPLFLVSITRSEQSSIQRMYLHETKTTEWRVLFLLSAAVYSVGIVMYAWLASGDVQPWATPTKPQSQDPETGNMEPSAPPQEMDEITAAPAR